MEDRFMLGEPSFPDREEFALNQDNEDNQSMESAFDDEDDENEITVANMGAAHSVGGVVQEDPSSIGGVVSRNETNHAPVYQFFEQDSLRSNHSSHLSPSGLGPAIWDVKSLTERVAPNIRDITRAKHAKKMTAHEIHLALDDEEAHLVNAAEAEFYQQQNYATEKEMVKKEHDFFVDDNSILGWGLLWYDGPSYDHDFDTSDLWSIDCVGCIKNCIFIGSGKKLYGVGLNKWRELGRLVEGDIKNLTLLFEFPDDITCISSGCTAQHVLVATKEDVYASGRNDNGQLGLGNKFLQGLPGFEAIDTKFAGDLNPADISKIVVGASASIIIGGFGMLYISGRINDFDTTGYFVNLELAMGDQMKFADAALGGSSRAGFMVLIAVDGTLWSVGANKHGQLGHSQGDMFAGLKMVENQKFSFEKVVAGESHFAAVEENPETGQHRLWTCGNSNDGRLGRGMEARKDFSPVTGLPNKEIISVNVTRKSTSVMMSDGEVYYMGDNTSKLFSSDRSIDTPRRLGDFIIGSILGSELAIFVVAHKCPDGYGAIQNIYFPKTCERCRGRLSKFQIDGFMSHVDIRAIGEASVKKQPRMSRKSKVQARKKPASPNSLVSSPNLTPRNHSSKNILKFAVSGTSHRDLLGNDHSIFNSYSDIHGNLSVEDTHDSPFSFSDSAGHSPHRSVDLGGSQSSLRISMANVMRVVDSSGGYPDPKLPSRQSTMLVSRKSKVRKKTFCDKFTYDNVMDFLYKSSFGIAVQHIFERGFLWFDVGTDVWVLGKIVNAAESHEGSESNLAIFWAMLFFFAICAPYIVCWTAGLRYLEQKKNFWLKAVYVLPFTGLGILVVFDIVLLIEAFIVNPIKLILMLFGVPGVKINIPTRDQFSYSRLKTLSELFLENLVQISLQASIWYSGQGEVLGLTTNDLILAAGSAGLNVLFQIYSLSLEAQIYDMNFFDYALLIMEGNFAFTPYLDSIATGKKVTVDYSQDDYGTLHMNMESLSNLKRALEAPRCCVKEVILGDTCKELKENEREMLWHVHNACAKQYIIFTESYTDDMIRKDGAAVLRMAAAKGLVGTVQSILNLPKDMHVDPNQSTAQDGGGGLTALMFACKNEHYFVVRQLLDKEHIMDTERPVLNLDAQDNLQFTALMHVVQSKRLNIDFVRILLDHEQDINIQDHRGRTALAMLCTRPYNKDKAANQSLRIILDKMRETIDINLADNEGMTPLMHAARTGNGPIVRQLMFHYRHINKKKTYLVDINKQDDLGRTALHYACMEGHELVVNLLCTKDDINIDIQSFQQDMGCTPFMFACDWGHEEVIDALLNNKCDTSLKNKWNRTALMRSVRANQLSVVRLLLTRFTKSMVMQETDDKHTDYLSKHIFDYANQNARMLAIFHIHLKSEHLRDLDPNCNDYKLEQLVNWTQYHENDDKLLKILKLCDDDVELAQARYNKIVDYYTKHGLPEVEHMVDKFLRDLYVERAQMNVTGTPIFE